MWARIKRAFSPRSKQPLELPVEIKHQGDRPSDQLSGDAAVRARYLEDKIAHTEAELELLKRNLSEGRIDKNSAEKIFQRQSYNLYQYRTEYQNLLRAYYNQSRESSVATSEDEGSSSSQDEVSSDQTTSSQDTTES